MNPNEDCCVATRDSLVVCSENKKKFVAKNSGEKKIYKCRVDGCWIVGETVRCDYLLQVEAEAIYLVELKGTDHIHALEQLICTAEQLNLRAFYGDKKSIIVGAPCPKSSTKYQAAQKRLRSRFKAVGLEFPTKKNGCLTVCV